MEKKNLPTFGRSDLALRRMGKARKDLIVARFELLQKSYDWSIYQSYFAAFNAMRALIALRNPAFTSEESEIKKFDFHFVNKNLFPTWQARVVSSMKKLKEEVIWGDFVKLSGGEAKSQIRRAEKFISTAHALLTRLIIQANER